MAWKLRDADRTLRLFITAFLLTVTAGYTIGFIFVDHTTSATPAGISGEFRGDEGTASAPTGEMKFEKSPREMYTFLHNHVFSLGILFFCVGAVFYGASMPERLKRFLLVEPFLAIATTFGGVWLTRFVAPAFSWLVILSGVSMIACYAVMFTVIMKDLWFRR